MRDQSLKVAAYIPARIGSVRVKEKNLRLLAGKPLVSYVCQTARQARSLHSAVVNTDSERIADVARQNGVAVYLRDPELALDHVMTDEILYDFAKKSDADAIAIINPTAPFLTAASIDLAVATYAKSPSQTLFTTNRMKKHLIYDGNPVNFALRSKSPRTQDLKYFEYINFIIIVISRSNVVRRYELSGSCLFYPPFQFMEISGVEAHDIDTLDDFLFAEALISLRGT